MRTLKDIDANRAEVLEQKAELEAEAEHIKLKLSDAKARVRNSGEYSDQDWWYRANDALRIKKKEIRKLARRLSELKAERSEVGQAVHMARTSSTESDVRKEVTAVLFKIARLAEDSLVLELHPPFRKDVEALLSELDRLRPNWRTS